MILVLNCGSSSIKYRLFAGIPSTGTASHTGTASAGPASHTGPACHAGLAQRAAGLVERIGEPGGPANHTEALGSIAVDAELTAVGHRVVHGGARFVEPTLIDDDVMAGIEALNPLAPLHNPPALAGIAVARRRWPGVPHVAVFDTAFHATLPPAAATYALDTEVAARLQIRRYGFHGISHAYVSRETAKLLGRPVEDVNVIVLHLGNGASACAVRGGRSVETSMGMTPLEGLVMGSRSGDIDPAVLLYLQRAGGYSPEEVDDLLNRGSGMRGLCGDNDMRIIGKRRSAGDPAAALAFEVYAHRLRKYIGAYFAVLGHVDAVTFTGGVGEHDDVVRALACNGLDGFGLQIDPAANQARDSGPRFVSPPGARVATCVVPTDEELEIATETRHLLAA